MEIEITEKKNNPFLNRTEVKFIISHINQSTPNQAIIRNELAQSLNAKKEHIIIDHIESHFGIQKTKGYAKVYTSRKEAESIERKHLLKRNKAEGKKAEKEAPKEEVAAPEKAEEAPQEEAKEEVKEKPDEAAAEQPKEEA